MFENSLIIQQEYSISQCHEVAYQQLKEYNLTIDSSSYVFICKTNHSGSKEPVIRQNISNSLPKTICSYVSLDI